MRQKFMLWCTARCMSNIFLRSFEARPDFACRSAPYGIAKFVGDDRSGVLVKYFDYQEGFKYIDVKNSMIEFEEKYLTKNILLKDHYYNFIGAPHPLEEVIPKGYTHGILFRDPVNTFISLRNLFLKINFEITLENIAEFVNYEKLYQTYEEIIEKGIDPNPVIINTSLLADKPEQYLREICRIWELEYLPEMMDFPNATTCLTDYPAGDVVNWRTAAIESTTWRKETEHCESDLLSYPVEIQEYIHYQELYYEKLNKLCLRLE